MKRIIGLAVIVGILVASVIASVLLRADRPEAAALPAPSVTPRAGIADAAPVAGIQRFVIVPEKSQVVYRVAETFIREGNRLNTAVGVTRTMRGELQINRANPSRSTIGSITVDISAFRSDSDRRDQAIRDRWLESARFPNAVFTPTAIRGLPSSYEEGRQLRLQITGTLTVRDVTRPVTFEATIVVKGNTLTGLATAAVRMTDFGFDPPSILGILRAENEVAIELAITARAQ